MGLRGGVREGGPGMTLREGGEEIKSGGGGMADVTGERGRG